MGQEEFVILLGEPEQQAGEVKPEPEVESDAGQEEFVILLDGPEAKPPVSENLPLPAHAGVAEVAGFYQHVAELLEEGDELRLRGDKVSQMDTAFAQLLVAASRKLRSRGGRLLVECPSETMLEVMARLDVARHLDSVCDSQ